MKDGFKKRIIENIIFCVEDSGVENLFLYDPVLHYSMSKNKK